MVDANKGYRRQGFEDVCTSRTIYDVYWCGERAAELSVNGKIEWTAIDPAFDTILGRGADYPHLPTTFTNLNPRVSFLGELLGASTRQQYFTGPEQVRLLANMTLVEQGSELTDPVKVDRHVSTLNDYKKGYEFTGDYDGVWGFANDPIFHQALKVLWQNRIDHRFSGMQIKMPFTQRSDGSLEITEKSSFTHLVKLSESGVNESKTIIEAACLSVSDAMEIPTAGYALVPAPNNDLPPALVVERYDIPHVGEAETRYLQQDFYVLNGLDPADETKTKAVTIEDLFKTVVSEHQKHDAASTQAESVRALLGRVLASYLCNDDDMHAKNVSMLYKVSEDGVVQPSLAPAYDITCDVVSEYATTRSFLSLNDSNDYWQMSDLMSLCDDEGLAEHMVGPRGAFDSKEEMECFITDKAQKAADHMSVLVEDVPAVMKTGPNQDSYIEDLRIMASHLIERAQMFGAEVVIPEWDAKLWQDKRTIGAGRRDVIGLRDVLDGPAAGLHPMIRKAYEALQN